ncbi:MAG TPA: adenosylcobinamide-GDP ribazoletransferase [Candidatus Nanopelagicales bacterium]|nr:adenosylcobinamide-GDP ribazoletransferase [Candidatus Nanopelagicales bacterium]
MPDALRLALGTLTAIRVPAPRTVDRRTSGRAMLLAPFVGTLLALLAGVVIAAVRIFATAERPASTVDLLAAVLGITVLALLTRGLHLDGLADLADATGVKGVGDAARERRLAVMREPAVGAFGVAAMVLTVLLQVTALTECSVAHYGTVALLTAVTSSRLAATWACTVGVPSARPEGLGALVSGSVSRRAALAVTVVVLLGAAALGRFDDDGTLQMSGTLVVAALVALAVGWFVRRRAERLLGGVTGDVLGAIIELATAAALVTTAIGADLDLSHLVLTW